MRTLNERDERIFEFAAACDLSAAKANEFTARWGGSTYSSVGRMLNDAKLDVLWVCTPPAARGAGESAALGAGIALWIEPPIAATIRMGNALAAQIKRSGVPVTVYAPHRYSPELERLRRFLAGKCAPQLELWNAEFGAALSKAAWRTDPKNGGVWLDAAWPLLDCLRFLGVEAEEASARGNGACGTSAVQLRDGALASLSVSRFGTHPEDIRGEGQGIELRIQNWTKTPRVELRLDRETTIWQGEETLTRQLESFARLLTTGKRTENRSTYGEALLSLKWGLDLGKAKS